MSLYDAKKSYGEAPALDLWGMWSNNSLPLLPSPLEPGLIEPDESPSTGQIEVFDILTVQKQMVYVKLNC